MATPFTTDEVLELLFDEGNDDIDEHFDLGSDNELEFNINAKKYLQLGQVMITMSVAVER